MNDRQYCSKCGNKLDKEHDWNFECAAMKDNSELEKEIWNAAIEAAAELISEQSYDSHLSLSEEIRKLKK